MKIKHLHCDLFVSDDRCGICEGHMPFKPELQVGINFTRGLKLMFMEWSLMYLGR